MWKIWHDEFLLILRERFINQNKTTNTQSKWHPKIGQNCANFPKNLRRGAWNLGKIIKLIEIENGEIRAGTLLLSTRNTVNIPINLI